MKIEHTAYQVEDPAAMARWYVAHLGLTLVRAQDVAPFGQFLADDGGAVMLELYRSPTIAVPDYRAMDPLTLHIAFVADDVAAVRARLLAAGATAEGEVATNAAGDTLAMLRDPWGLAIQFVRRKVAMIG
ncbi:MAG TPA: VOC family protein [Vicinamibacterales bacterium]|jgi:catechol 2,3-dioxygenase-like lactoylglutathione lyase family enzyme|nr:VOC family protein [Vicinamibacterales bacterium]